MQKQKNGAAARLNLLLVLVLSRLLLLGAELRENTLLDRLLDRLDVLLQLLAALDILLVLAEGVKVAVVPGFLHGASEAEDVLSSADLCSHCPEVSSSTCHAPQQRPRVKAELSVI